MRATRNGDRWAVEGSWYRLHGTIDGPVAILEDLDGTPWAELRLLASVDTREREDETFSVTGPEIDGGDPGDELPVGATRGAAGNAAAGTARLTWRLESSGWRAKRLTIEAADAEVTVRVSVEGDGALTDVSMLAGRVVSPRASGWLMSGSWFESVVPGGPADPGRIVLAASESTSIGVVSGSEPGRGRWFFSPGPFVFAAARDRAEDPVLPPGGPWLAFAVDGVPGEAAFTDVAWHAVDRGFGITIDYDGQTRVDGEWTSPSVVISRGDGPYSGIVAQRERLGRPRPPVEAPGWWREPIFCGWGAQCADAAADGESLAGAARRSTQANYDRWLAHLEAEGIVPGTIVIDDKWQATYGANDADPDKWPDLRGWIAKRHERGQRVLLWYKAWDPEGLPAEICVRTTAGAPIAVDPTHPEAEAAIRHSVRTMLGADTLGADGLKIDFTHRTPSGRATVHHGREWGVDLLRRLLEILADEAARTKPDALLVGQSPNPIVAPAIGMIRLNDALRLDDPHPDVDIVPQMRHRAAIVAAACPDHLIDTDDWCVPDLATWRAYTALKPELGIPALYYATHLDRTGEPFEASDDALVRDTWATYRARVGLPPRPPTAARDATPGEGSRRP